MVLYFPLFFFFFLFIHMLETFAIVVAFSLDLDIDTVLQSVTTVRLYMSQPFLLRLTFPRVRPARSIWLSILSCLTVMDTCRRNRDIQEPERKDTHVGQVEQSKINVVKGN